MPMVKKSITVTDNQDAWIQAQMKTGNYASDSEVLRALIRKEQTQSKQMDTIRAALIEAEESRFTDGSVDDIVNTVIKRKQENGTLKL